MAARQFETAEPRPEQPGSCHKVPAGGSEVVQVVACGLPVTAKLPTVWKHFMRFGEVTSVDFDFGADGQFTGSSVVTFASSQAAKKALESTGEHTLHGNVVECLSVLAFAVDTKLEGNADLATQWEAFCRKQDLPSCSPRECRDEHLLRFLGTLSKKRPKAAAGKASFCQSFDSAAKKTHQGEQKVGQSNEERAGSRGGRPAPPTPAPAVVDVPEQHCKKQRLHREAGDKELVENSAHRDRYAAEPGVKESQRPGVEAEAATSRVIAIALRLLRAVGNPVPAGLLDARIAAEDLEVFVSVRAALPQSATVVEALLDDGVVKRCVIKGYLCVAAR